MALKSFSHNILMIIGVLLFNMSMQTTLFHRVPSSRGPLSVAEREWDEHAIARLRSRGPRRSRVRRSCGLIKSQLPN